MLTSSCFAFAEHLFCLFWQLETMHIANRGTFSYHPGIGAVEENTRRKNTLKTCRLRYFQLCTLTE